eukprot:TRINITY_DN11994_c0_g1_i1.p1 TRINITY_DN11994_c0_g1~~TRINITY_DN11994_c0_g1_i1.p1  ORF type:complete len:232 (+),score=31.44 TRINITY_DN11994_c0_g1_i1:156-851(+)
MGCGGSKEEDTTRYNKEVRVNATISSWDKDTLTGKIEDSPEDPECVVEYAVYLAQAGGSVDDAEICFTRAFEMDKDNISVYGPYALFLEFARKDKQKAGQIYEDGYKIVCKKPFITEKDADFMNNYAMYALNTKNNARQAEDIYKRILVSQPNHSQANGNYGLLLKRNENYDSAEEKFRKAIQFAPNDPHWYYTLGYFLRDVKRNKQDGMDFINQAKDMEKQQSASASNRK